MALSEKYRPQTFETVLGQADAVAWCRAQLGLQRPGSVLLHGPTGTGKTTIARIYAAAILCEARQTSPSPCWRCASCRSFRSGTPFDYFMHNCAQTTAGDVSALLDITRLNPLGGGSRVILFDEAHRLTPKSFDMLLTVLERPRSNVFLFATTEFAKIPAMIVNRCATVEVSLLDNVASVRHLADICAKENIQAEQDALDLLAFQAAGHVRALVQFLEDAVENGTVTAAGVRRHFHLDFCDRLTAFVRATLDNRTGEALRILDEWPDEPARKRQLIHACLVEIYRQDVLSLRP